MLLEGGPADGWEVPRTPAEPWVWVDILNDALAVFDLNRCEEEQFPDRSPRGGWMEYEMSPEGPGVYRFSRFTPRNRS